METPFDTLIDDLWQALFSTHKHSTPSDFFTLVYSFAKVARVLFVNMAQATEMMQNESSTRRLQSGLNAWTIEDMREHDDYHIRCRLSYLQFIEQLNRTGRVLKDLGHILPLYNRIYFFMNKMVEHWDDYLEFLSKGTGLIFYSGKIAIPYDFAGISEAGAIRSSLQQELIEDFARYGAALPSLVDKWYGEYSEMVYAALEKIDIQLRSQKNGKGPGLPETITTLLFKYSFLTPISDVEEYCKNLAEWLSTLPLS
jgi:hypothetical protein